MKTGLAEILPNVILFLTVLDTTLYTNLDLLVTFKWQIVFMLIHSGTLKRVCAMVLVLQHFF